MYAVTKNSRQSNGPATKIDSRKMMNQSHLLDHLYGASAPVYQPSKKSPVLRPSRAMAEPAPITNFYKSVKRQLPTNKSPAPGPPKVARRSRAASSVRSLSISPTPSNSSLKKRNTINSMEQGTRYDTSLGLLTRKFVDLLEHSSDGVVDLNIASAMLNVQKRRIYDITNVLEGIGVLEKKSKNNIQWKREVAGGANLCQLQDLHDERMILQEKENSLDSMLDQLTAQIARESSNQTAYITCNDLNNLEQYKDQLVIVVRAPPEAKMILSDDDPPRQINFTSDKGEIDVFFLPEAVESGQKMETPINKPTLARRVTPRSAQRNLCKTFDTMPPSPGPQKQLFGGMTVQRNLLSGFSGMHSSLSVKHEVEDDHSFKRIRAQLTQEDLNLLDSPTPGTSSSQIHKDVKLFSPQKKNEELMSGVRNLLADMTSYSPVSYLANVPDMDSFFAIEPLSDTDYNFSLGNSEGVLDLWDLV